MKSETAILKDILSGKYRDCYLIYNRKSTDDLDNQKNSIKYQKLENMRFAHREHLPIASISLEGFATDGLVSERHSGFKEDLQLLFGKTGTVQYRLERPKFHRLVQFLSGGHFKGAIFLCWDRASRNKGDDTILRKLMKAGVDVRFALAHYEKTSAGELHMDIDGMFAEHHSRVTREKVSITIRNARARGLCTNRAPVGYLNEGNMEHKPHDPTRAPIILRLAELADTGEWSLADLASWAIAQGFTMPPMRRRRTREEILAEEEDDLRVQIEPISRLPTFNTIHKILTNRFYTGKVQTKDGEWIPSTSHQAIIPEDLFVRVQDRLAKKNKSTHYAELLNLPLRGIARCLVCGRVYTPYVKKGVVYYGARCARDCINPMRSFNFGYIVKKVEGLIAQLSFTERELAEIDAQASTDIALLETKRMTQLEAVERKKKKLREDFAYLNGNRLNLLKAGVYTPEGYVAEEARLSGELATLCQAEVASDVSMRETIKDVIRLSELLTSAAAVYDFATPQEKEKIIRIIFSELNFNGETLEYKCKKGFAALQSRFVASGDPTGWLSELAWQSDLVRASISDLNELLLKPTAADA